MLQPNKRVTIHWTCVSLDSTKWNSSAYQRYNILKQLYVNLIDQVKLNLKLEYILLPYSQYNDTVEFLSLQW